MAPPGPPGLVIPTLAGPVEIKSSGIFHLSFYIWQYIKYLVKRTGMETNKEALFLSKLLSSILQLTYPLCYFCYTIPIIRLGMLFPAMKIVNFASYNQEFSI